MTFRLLPLLFILHSAFCLLTSPSAAPVLTYDFSGDLPYIADLSGHGNSALAPGCVRATDDGRTCLQLKADAPLRLPEASLVLGPHPERGSIELSVKPDFDPLALPEGVYEGWVALVYFQKTSGNGLPDGYNEVGLALHGRKLIAKAGADCSPFAMIDSPLAQGKWTQLRLEWEPNRRALYVDGTLAAESAGAYDAPNLDAFPAYIGLHPASHKWGFSGLVAGVKITTN